jgi:translocation and assembly module TamB
MSRWLKFAVALVGALVLVLLAATALAYGWLHTQSGRGWVEARVSEATAGQVRMEGLEGALPFRAAAARLMLSDSQGVWLTAERVRFSIRPASLLRLQLEIEAVSAARIAVARRPEPVAKAAQADTSSFPPQLPVSIELRELSASEILLARPVAGQAARLSLTGSGALSKGSARLLVTAQRLDAPGSATVDLAYDGLRLGLDAAIDDPGGLAARALGARSDVPAMLRASGEGPLRSWRGAVQARLAEAHSNLTIALQDGRLTTSGSLDPRPLLQPRIAALLPEPLRVEATAVVGERRTLERFAVSSGANRLSFEGALHFEDMTGSGQARLALPDMAVLQPLLGMPLGGAVTGTADIETTSVGQTARLALSAEGVAAEGYGARSLLLDATAQRARGADEIALAGSLQGAGIAASARPDAPALPADLALHFDGTVSPSARRIVARRFIVTGEGAEIGFVGTADLEGLLDGTLHVSVPRLARFAQLARLNWDGAIALDARLAASPGAGSTRFELDGTWQDPSTGIAALDPALGSSITLTAAGIGRYDGALEIERASAQSQTLGMSLMGHLSADGPIDARFEVTTSDLGTFRANTALAGAARIAGTVTGTAAAPLLRAEASSSSLSVAGTELRTLAVAVDLTELRPTLRGTIGGSGVIAGARAEFASTLAMADRTVSLPGLRLRAHGSRIAGDIAVALDGGAVTGVLQLDAPDLAPWSALARVPLEGSARGKLTLREDGGASAEATGVGLTVGRTRIEALRATAALGRWRESIAGKIELTATGLSAGATSLETATLRLDPKGDVVPLRFAGKGHAAAPFALNAEGAYEPSKRRLRLTALTGTYARKPVSLRDATAVTFRDGIAVAPFDLAWGGARIGGELSVGTRLSGTLRVGGLPLEDLAALAGRTEVQGTARATLALSGTRADPTATLEAAISDLAFSGRGEESPAGDLTFSGTLGRSRLEWQAKLASGEADLALSGSGALPVAWSSPPFGIAIDPAGPLRARLEGSGEIAPLIALAGVGEDRASGRYAIDLAIAGSLAAPTVSGSATVENGFYENFVSGAQLHNLRLAASGARDRLQLTLAATDGDDGRIEGGGTIAVSGASIASMDLDARLVGFRAIRRDDVRARATGDFALAGALDELMLSGRVRIDRMSIDLPERSGVAAPALDVVEVNAPAAGAERVARTSQAQGAPAAFKIGLDIAAELPRVDVAGRGLRSEWHGAVSVSGTTVAPQIGGEIRLDRGTFSALGKTFTLTEGLITFGGGPELDPSIRVIAEKQVRDAVARATLTGSLSSPLLEFSARPELPVDEVLARLLFDKGAGQVGAAEALQLAQVAAALQGGGASPDMMSELGQKLGLDRIDVSTVETVDKETGEAGEAAALSLGKEVSEDVRVGVEQGIQPGTGSVTVEVDLGKNLSVESRVGAEGRSGVGLKWEYDY